MISYDPQETLTHLIYRVGRMFRYRAAEYLKQWTPVVSPEQWAVLLRLHSHGPGTMSSLVDPVLNDHPNVTRLVTGLERLGLVGRNVNPDDARSRLVELSAEGKDFIGHVLPGILEEKGRFYEGLNEREVAMLATLLKIVEANLER